MPIKLKTGDTTWSTLKKVYLKTSSSVWSPAKAVFVKLATGWQQIWPGNTPAVNPSDPIDIRITGYNGPRAVSPEYINTVLYGNDGSFTGDTPITISNRKMYISEDDTGTTSRYLLESVDKYDLTSNSETDVGYKRYMADGWWLFYQLTATNISGDTIAYSPPIKIIRQIPTASTYTLAEDYSSLPYYSSYTFDIVVSDIWYKAADLSRSYVVWWENTTTSPGGTELQKTYLDQIDYYSTTRSGSNSDYNGTGTTYSAFDIYTQSGEPTAGKYIVAQLVLVNSYTDYYSVTQSYYRSSGTQAAFGSVAILDSQDNSALDRRGNLPVSASFAHVVNVTGVNASTSYRVRYRIYNNQASTNTYYNPETGASGSSGMWKTFSSTGGDDGSSYISDITSTSDSSVTLTDYYFIDEAKFPPVTYTDTVFGAQYPKWALEVEISALTNGVRTYAWPGLNYNSENLSPASSISISPSPSSGSSPLTVIFSGTTTPFPNISGYRAYPVAYKINWGDGTGDSSWQYFSSGYNNTFSIEHTYSSGGTYYPTVITMPYYEVNVATVEAIVTPAAPSFLTASTNLEDGVQLSWENTGANYYEIYWQSIQGGGPVNQSSYADFGQLNEITTNSYKDTTIPAGGTRYYRVRARNNSTANGSYTSNWYPNYGSNAITGTRVLITPAVPTGLSGSGVGSTALQKISLSWNSASNAAYYELYYNGTGTRPEEGFGADYGSDGSITTTSFTTPYASYSANTTYYWWVRSVSSGGAKSIWSSTTTVTTNRETFTVTWNANLGSVSPSSSTTDSNGYVTTPTPTRSGYSFNGWYDRPTGDYLYGPISGGISWLAPSTITMYARWSVANLTPPAITSVSAGAAGGPVSVYFNGGSGPYYQMYWTTGVGGTGYDEYGYSSPITDQSGPSLTGYTWYAYVRSVSSLTNTGTGPSSTISEWSAGYPFTVTSPNASAPAYVNAGVSANVFTVSWPAASNATKYRVYWVNSSSTSADPASSYDGETTGTSIQFTLSYNSSYYFFVSASGDNNVWTPYNSARSSQVTSGSQIVTSYGSCEAYGSAISNTSGYYCDGTYSQNYTDSTYYARRQILTNGSWSGAYDYSGCSTVTVRSLGSSSQVNGQCGYTASTTTYSSCYEYSRSSGSCYCNGNAQSCSGTTYNRRDMYINGSFITSVYDCANGTWSSYDPYGCYVPPTLVYWRCLQSDVDDPSSPCYYVNQCLYEGNAYYPQGCTP